MTQKHAFQGGLNLPSIKNKNVRADLLRIQKINLRMPHNQTRYIGCVDYLDID